MMKAALEKAKGVVSLEDFLRESKFLESASLIRTFFDSAKLEDLIPEAIHNFIEALLTDEASAIRVRAALTAFLNALNLVSDKFLYLMQLERILKANESHHALHITKYETFLRQSLVAQFGYKEVDNFIFCEDPACRKPFCIKDYNAFASRFIKRVEQFYGSPTPSSIAAEKPEEQFQQLKLSANALEKRCNACNEEATDSKRLLNCSRCKQASYCDSDCQKKHWPTHQASCKAPANKW